MSVYLTYAETSDLQTCRRAALARVHRANIYRSRQSERTEAEDPLGHDHDCLTRDTTTHAAPGPQVAGCVITDVDTRHRTLYAGYGCSTTHPSGTADA
jgi:hypothetical protein